VGNLQAPDDPITRAEVRRPNAAHGETVGIELHVDVLRGDARQCEQQRQPVGGLMDVHRRFPADALGPGPQVAQEAALQPFRFFRKLEGLQPHRAVASLRTHGMLRERPSVGRRSF
jgi:hypothetical protein